MVEHAAICSQFLIICRPGMLQIEMGKFDINAIAGWRNLKRTFERFRVKRNEYVNEMICKGGLYERFSIHNARSGGIAYRYLVILFISKILNIIWHWDCLPWEIRRFWKQKYLLVHLNFHELNSIKYLPIAPCKSRIVRLQSKIIQNLCHSVVWTGIFKLECSSYLR